MSSIAKQPKTPTRREPSGFDLLVVTIFKKALPVWERYNGEVPLKGLRKLELAGDWPRGLAAVVIKRLSEDEYLRNQIRKLVARRSEETGSASEPTA